MRYKFELRGYGYHFFEAGLRSDLSTVYTSLLAGKHHSLLLARFNLGIPS